MSTSESVTSRLLDSSDQIDSSISLSINDQSQQYVAPHNNQYDQSTNQTNHFPSHQSNDQSISQQQYNIHTQPSSSINQSFSHTADPSNDQYSTNNSSNQSLYQPLYQLAPHLRHLERERRLPPYEWPMGFKDLWSNFLSRGSKAFVCVIVFLWLIMFSFANLRLVGAFLPFLFIPAGVFAFIVNNKFMKNVEVNLLLNQFIMGFSAIAIATLIIETLLTVLFACITLLPFQYDETSAWFQNQIDNAENGETNPEDMFQGFSRTVPFFLFIFLLSFCVAGCVEEGAKGWLGLRPKKITPGYRDKNGILVYLISGALGFSTFENIAYATAVTTPALSVFVNVLTRAFISTPLHLCCSYLVGVGIVRREVFGQKINWFRVFALPVALHGGFDFALIVCSAVMDPESSMVILADCLIVFVTFVLIAISIYMERKHIEGDAQILPVYDQSTDNYLPMTVNQPNHSSTQLATM